MSDTELTSQTPQMPETVAPDNAALTAAVAVASADAPASTGVESQALAVAGSEPEPEPEPELQPRQSPGALIRAAREAAGVDRSALALALKVSVRKLEALEDDQFDQLPDLVFARALASSVCRTLKIDAREILALLPQTHAPRLQSDDSGLNTPFRTPGDIARTPWLDRLSRPMVLAALAILLGAVVIIFFPAGSPAPSATVTEPVPNPTTGAGATAQAGPAPEPAPEAQLPATAASAPVAATVAEVVPPAQTVAPSAAQSPAQAVSPMPAAKPIQTQAQASVQTALQTSPQTSIKAAAPAAPVAATVTAATQATTKPQPVPAAAPSGATRQIAFKTRGPSWIEVLDASGTVLISRHVDAGEVATVNGVAPLRVTVGRTDLTDVSYQGKPFDLAPYAKQGVARFEVKP